MTNDNGSSMPSRRRRDRRDRDVDVLELFLERRRDRLAALVTGPLIEEHRHRPIGDHSPGLAAVLVAMREQPVAGKLALYESVADREWQVIRLAGERATAHDLSGPDHHSSLADALHAVFVQRLVEWGLAGSGR